MSMKDLDHSIADQKKSIERAETAMKGPEKLLG
jgi:hypothetical protein